MPTTKAMSLDTAIARVSQLEAALFPTAAAQTTTPTADTTSLTGTGMTGATFASTLQGAMATQGVTSGSGAGNAMVQIAESQIGQSEQPPGSNDGPAISMYRTATAGTAGGEPWCAYFASWVAKQAGEPIGSSGQGLGYVGDIWSWAQQTGRAIPNGPGVTPTPGDLIVFGDHHVGIVDKVLPNGDIQTIEGNYSNKVSQVVRSPGEATGYVRM
ncbi:MAG: CHAP domain-containing protein [Solirubrobacteraceae bacterium]